MTKPQDIHCDCRSVEPAMVLEKHPHDGRRYPITLDFKKIQPASAAVVKILAHISLTVIAHASREVGCVYPTIQTSAAVVTRLYKLPSEPDACIYGRT